MKPIILYSLLCLFLLFAAGNYVKDKSVQDSSQMLKYPPQRVIAVWQNSVETLLALGLQDRIVAAIGVPNEQCIKEEYREDYRNLPVVSTKSLDCETMLMLEPDFILAWESTFTDKVIRTTQFWRKRHVNTYIAASSQPTKKEHKIEDEYNYILDLGKIFLKEERAEQIVNEMKTEIRLIQEKTQGTHKPTALIMEFAGNQVTTYGKDTLAGDILSKVNGELLPAERKIGFEQLIELNPDVIFLIVSEEYYGNNQFLVDKIIKNVALQGVKAVQNKRIYVVPLYCMYNSAVRTIDGIQLFAKGLHPQLYKEY